MKQYWKKQQKEEQDKKLKYWLKTSQKCGKATKLINNKQFQKTQKTSKISESQKRSKLNRISPLNLVVKAKLAERLKKAKSPMKKNIRII